MPFYVRSVSPVRISVLPDSVRHFVIAAQNAQLAQLRNADGTGEPTLELELFTHESLVNVIRQLSAFCANANDLLGELSNALRNLNERGRLLGERVERIRERAQNGELVRSDATLLSAGDAKRPYCSSHLDEPVRNQMVRRRTASQPNVDGKGKPEAIAGPRASHSSSEIHRPVSLFCERPTAMQTMYARAESPPALSELNEYREDQVNALSFYSNPAFYLDAEIPSGPKVPNAEPPRTLSTCDSAALTAEYDALRSGLAVATLGRGGLARAAMRDNLLARMRQLRLEQAGQSMQSVQRGSVQLDATPLMVTNPQVAKQKSVNFNLSANVVGVASGARSSASSTSSSTNTLATQLSPVPAPPVQELGVMQRPQVEQQAKQQAQFINPAQMQQLMLVGAGSQPMAVSNGNGVASSQSPTQTQLNPGVQRPQYVQHQRSISQPPGPLPDPQNFVAPAEREPLMVNQAVLNDPNWAVRTQLTRQQSQPPSSPQAALTMGNGRTLVQTNGNAAAALAAAQNRQPAIYAPVTHLQQTNANVPVGYNQPQTLTQVAAMAKAAQAGQTQLGGYAVGNNNLSAPQGGANAPIDLKQAIMMNLAMNSGPVNANYTATGSGSFGQPSAQMLTTIQSILTDQAIGDTRAPVVVQSPLGVQLRSTMKQNQNQSLEAQQQAIAQGGRDRMSKELLAEIKQGVRLRRVSFADDENGES